jgi:high affinity Mn2+ porin
MARAASRVRSAAVIAAVLGVLACAAAARGQPAAVGPKVLLLPPHEVFTTQPTAEVPEKKPDQAGKKNPSDESEQARKSPPDEDKAAEAKKLLAEKPAPWWSAHVQGTVVSQGDWPFHSPYQGQNSFQSVQQLRTSETATLYLAAKLPWEGGQVIFDPEVAGGQGLSDVFGLGAFPNFEITRVGLPTPTPYIARLVLQQTIELGGEWEKLEDAPNQIPGHRDQNRITIQVGRMASSDGFDSNAYSHDGRTQAMNWAIAYNGAWDYPANVRGYTYGANVELNQPVWAIRYGIWMEPLVANGAEFDAHVLRAHGQALELEYRYDLGGLPGRVRPLFYLNRANMGDYHEALQMMPVNPDVTLTRSYRYKYGFGLNVEQEVTKDLGLFLRLGWDDGHSETWAFTEIDRTASFGMLLKGRRWQRPQDQVGLAYVIDGLSQDHRNYLAAGGLGFELGDGKLNYGLEQALEMYYNWEMRKGLNLTLDFQEIINPGDNQDRGPVSILALRMHFEF